VFSQPKVTLNLLSTRDGARRRPTEATIPPNFFKKQTILVCYYIFRSQYLFLWTSYDMVYWPFYDSSLQFHLKILNHFLRFCVCTLSHHQRLIGHDCIVLRLYFFCAIQYHFCLVILWQTSRYSTFLYL